MPMLRHKIATLVGALAVFSTVFLMGGVAHAQTGYPPGTGGTPCIPGNATAGNVAVGQTATFTLCVAASRVPFRSRSTAPWCSPKSALQRPGDHRRHRRLADRPPGRRPRRRRRHLRHQHDRRHRSRHPGYLHCGTFNLLCTSTTTTKSGLAFTGANILRSLLIALALIVLGALLVIFSSAAATALI